MSKIALAAVAGLALGACATAANNGSTAARISAPAGTQYCWQDRLENAGGKLTCNWAPSKREACDGAQFTTVEAARFATPRKGSMCANGQWLVELTPRG